MMDRGSFDYISCPTCDIDNAPLFLGVQDIVVCRKCGLIYVNPRRRSDETKSFFEQNYIPNELMLRQEFGDWREESLRRESELIKKRKISGRILDVGCAGGNSYPTFFGRNGIVAA